MEQHGGKSEVPEEVFSTSFDGIYFADGKGGPVDLSRQGEPSYRMTHAPVTIQITPESRPSIPFWMGEVAAFAQVLTHEGILKTIQEQVRFARARFGQYDLIDFVVVLIGYVVSGELTLLAFYERLAPWA